MATATNDKALPIAITMGDPAGVRPEIIARVLGTAFDIAGKGVADATGLRAAMRAAQAIVTSDLATLA